MMSQEKHARESFTNPNNDVSPIPSGDQVMSTDDITNSVKIAGTEELEAYRKKHPGWFFLSAFTSIALVLILIAIWLLLGAFIVRLPTERSMENNPFFAIALWIGLVGAGVIAVGLDLIATSIYSKYLPDYPSESLGRNGLKKILRVGIIICAISALAMLIIHG